MVSMFCLFYGIYQEYKSCYCKYELSVDMQFDDNKALK